MKHARGICWYIIKEPLIKSRSKDLTTNIESEHIFCNHFLIRENKGAHSKGSMFWGDNTTQVLLSAVRTYREGENIRKDGTTHQPRCTKEYGTQPKWPNLNAGEMLCTTDVPCTAGETHKEPPLIDWKNRNVLSGL